MFYQKYTKGWQALHPILAFAAVFGSSCVTSMIPLIPPLHTSRNSVWPLSASVGENSDVTTTAETNPNQKVATKFSSPPMQLYIEDTDVSK